MPFCVLIERETAQHSGLEKSCTCMEDALECAHWRCPDPRGKLPFSPWEEALVVSSIFHVNPSSLTAVDRYREHRKDHMEHALRSMGEPGTSILRSVSKEERRQPGPSSKACPSRQDLQGNPKARAGGSAMDVRQVQRPEMEEESLVVRPIRIQRTGRSFHGILIPGRGVRSGDKQACNQRLHGFEAGRDTPSNAGQEIMRSVSGPAERGSTVKN